MTLVAAEGMWIVCNARDVLTPAGGVKIFGLVRSNIIEVGSGDIVISVNAGQVVAVNEVRH